MALGVRLERGGSYASRRGSATSSPMQKRRDAENEDKDDDAAAGGRSHWVESVQDDSSKERECLQRGAKACPRARTRQPSPHRPAARDSLFSLRPASSCLALPRLAPPSLSTFVGERTLSR